MFWKRLEGGRVNKNRQEDRSFPNFLVRWAFAPALPIIAPASGDDRHFRCSRPQEQSLFASFSSEKEDSCRLKRLHAIFHHFGVTVYLFERYF